MKKLLSLLICILTIFALSSCGDDPCSHRDADDNSLCDNCGESYTDGKDLPDEHTHDYTVKNIDGKYLDKVADCENAATYYYSCSCGDKGTTTFAYGSAKEHSYSEELKYNSTHHYYECSCGDKKDETTHRSSGNATATSDEVCIDCGFVINGAVGIKFNTLETNGNNVYGNLANAVETFSFIEEITAVGGAKFVVSLDVYGMQSIATKIVPLSSGDNTFYVIEMIDGEATRVYTVVIRRKPIYQVRFDTAGGTSVATQYIEEDTLATEPATTREGYVFVGWNYDFSTPITQNTNVKASWSANTDTKYKVEYYLENLNDNGYALIETENLNGTTDTTANAAIKTFEHFTYNPSKGTASGNVDGSGTLVLRVYYTRDRFTLANENTRFGSITGGGTHKYGSNVTATATPKLGYIFVGWYSGERLLKSSTTYEFVIECNITAKFIPDPTLAPFYYTLSDYSCIITGLKDETVTEIIIPNSVTSIGEKAFYNCNNLTSVVIPDSVTSIGNHAFYNCDSLTSVVIGNSVTSIGSYAFSGCYRLVEVVNNSSLNITAGSSYYGYVAYYAKEVHKGEMKGVVNVDGYLFYTYNGVHYLVGYIGADTELTLPDSYNGENYAIKNYAFCSCDSLTSVVIPDSVTSIGDAAFCSCDSLTSVVIGNSVTSIGRSAFEGCDSLTSIKYRGTQYQWNAISKGDWWNNDTGSYAITYNYTGE